MLVTSFAHQQRCRARTWSPMEHLDADTARAFVAGELKAAARAWCEAHLEECPACRELVERERNWPKLLQLDEGVAPANGALERALSRVATVGPSRLRCVGLRLLGPVLVAGALAGFGLGLLIRAATAPAPAQRSAAALNISTEFQREVIANLDALAALQRDPWLAGNHEAAQWLKQLILDQGKP
jgi:anti-sigma factor RsiW